MSSPNSTYYMYKGNLNAVAMWSAYKIFVSDNTIEFTSYLTPLWTI